MIFEKKATSNFIKILLVWHYSYMIFLLFFSPSTQPELLETCTQAIVSLFSAQPPLADQVFFIF